jgi:hypothetical protein
MKKYAVVVMLLSMVVVAIPASASSYTCSGTVATAFVDAAGNVAVALNGTSGLPFVYLCTLGTTNNGWIPDACKAAYATLLADKLSGQNVTVTFFDSLTCSTQTPATFVKIINVQG